MVLVMALKKPAPDWHLAGRLLLQAEQQSLGVLCCLNKIDLDPHMTKEECIRDMNLSAVTENPWLVIPISALKQTNINDVVDWLVRNSHS